MQMMGEERIGMAAQSQLRAFLSAAARGGRLHHALLITGEGDRGEVLRLAAAAYECTGKDKPCLSCAHCRKVLAGIHPDVITAEDSEHKNLSVDVLRAIRTDAYIRPNEGARKVYLFPDASRLTVQDQNVILKLVEDGPPYTAFVFCAESPTELLLTLRSRCIELKSTGEARSEDDPAALSFAALLAERNREDLQRFLIGLGAGKMKREDLQHFLLSLRALLMRALVSLHRGESLSPELSGLAALPGEKISAVTSLLRSYAEDCEYNVGVGLILGAFAAELEELL